MKYSCLKLNDLPDEILMIIFQKLNNIEVLYSLENVNQQINRIIQDPIFTSRLTFVKRYPNSFIDLLSSDIILNRFLQILPKIHDKIKWLDLESPSMKNVLYATTYPNLDTLGLYNIDEQSIQSLFTDEPLSSSIFKNQITKLYITIDNSKETMWAMVDICDYTLTVFTSLIYLILYESSYKNRRRLLFDDPPSSTFRSSTLLKLKIRIQCFDDCLSLLDGRSSQLHTLCIDLGNIRRPQEVHNQNNLPNLKCFSLSSIYVTYDYDELIPPLLYRMSNLEELDLYLSVEVNKTFINENNLKKKILDCMPHLNQFRFYFCSFMRIYNEMNFSSTEDIQRTFINISNMNIISYVDYFPELKESRCHIYSYPSFMPYYVDITNNFPGGLFTHVRVVSLFDEQPFEHEFFLQITQSFPFMERLTLINHKSQIRKQSFESNNNNQNLSLIKYSFLNELGINDVHDDYIEQFLFDTKTYLQNNVLLYINYESLQRVTHNFTRDATRINCSKINELKLWGEMKCSNSLLQEYFPYAKISYFRIFSLCKNILFQNIFLMQKYLISEYFPYAKISYFRIF